MKKEELRYDPVHDRIASIIDYIDSNKNSVIQVLVALVIAVGFWGYYSNIERDKLNISKSLVGVAQNSYNTGQKDLAITELSAIVEEYSGSDAAAQALVYLLKDAYLENDDQAVLTLGATHKSNETDIVLNAGFYETLGNSEMNMGNIEGAINSFKKADKLASTKNDNSRFKMNMAFSLIQNNELNEAVAVLSEALDSESINFSDKSKIEELLAMAKFKTVN